MDEFKDFKIVEQKLIAGGYGDADWTYVFLPMDFYDSQLGYRIFEELPVN